MSLCVCVCVCVGVCVGVCMYVHAYVCVYLQFQSYLLHPMSEKWKYSRTSIKLLTVPASDNSYVVDRRGEGGIPAASLTADLTLSSDYHCYYHCCYCLYRCIRVIVAQYWLSLCGVHRVKRQSSMALYNQQKHRHNVYYSQSRILNARLPEGGASCSLFNILICQLVAS